jgi:signal transduction histidine kinase
MNWLNQRLTQAVDYSSERVKLASVLKHDLISVTRAEKNMVLAGSVEEMHRIATGIDETLEAMQQHVDQLRRTVLDRDREPLQTFARQWREWQRNHQDVRQFLALNADVQAKELALGEGSAAFQKWEQSLLTLAEELRRGPADGEGEAAEGAASGWFSENLFGIMQHVAGLLSNASQIERAEKDLLLADSDEEIERFERAFAEPLRSVEVHFQALKGLLHEGTPQEALGQAISAFESYTQTLSEIRHLVGQKGNWFVRQLVNEVGGPFAADCERLLEEIIAQNESDLRDYRDESTDFYLRARNSLFAFSALGIALSVAVTFMTGQRLARHLKRLTDYVHVVQNTGDLSQSVPRLGDDEIGILAGAFDQMRVTLHERTTELARLNQKLEQKNRELEQFFYTVSHDLSSPLISCKGLLTLIQQDVAEGNYGELAVSTEKLDRALDQLKQIIDDLLALSRLGRKRLKPVEVNVTSLIGELEEELADRLAAVGAELRLQGRLPKVIADAKDLRRVFENLLTNAIKYGCVNGDAVIEVGAVVTQDELRYCVRDHGPGIDPKYQEKVFGLFQRLDSDKPGTGLGLASVAKIMQLHGGRAWLEPTPGCGATFWVAFPARREPF